jgi:hypothetical protein
VVVSPDAISAGLAVNFSIARPEGSLSVSRKSHDGKRTRDAASRASGGVRMSHSYAIIT